MIHEEYFDKAKLLDITEKEFIVYQVLIEHGSMSISEISKFSQMNQRSVYDYLGRLVHKGLVGQIQVNGSKHFLGLNPELISYLIDENRKNLRKEMESIKSLLNAEYHETAYSIIPDKNSFFKHLRTLEGKSEVILGSDCDSIIKNPSLIYFLRNKVASKRRLRDMTALMHDSQIKVKPASIIIIISKSSITIFSIKDEKGFCAKGDDFVNSIRCYFG